MKCSVTAQKDVAVAVTLQRNALLLAFFGLRTTSERASAQDLRDEAGTASYTRRATMVQKMADVDEIVA